MHPTEHISLYEDGARTLHVADHKRKIAISGAERLYDDANFVEDVLGIATGKGAMSDWSLDSDGGSQEAYDATDWDTWRARDSSVKLVATASEGKVVCFPGRMGTNSRIYCRCPAGEPFGFDDEFELFPKAMGG